MDITYPQDKLDEAKALKSRAEKLNSKAEELLQQAKLIEINARKTAEAEIRKTDLYQRARDLHEQFCEDEHADLPNSCDWYSKGVQGETLKVWLSRADNLNKFCKQHGIDYNKAVVVARIICK